MKELSIEEKAKAYDKAIQQLRSMMPNWEHLSYNGKTFLQDLIYIFPELKETEDERIRKALICYMTDYSDGHGMIHTNGVTRNEAIAWLKKQGEQKPADKIEPKFHEGEWLCENEPNNYARFIQILEIVNIQGKERYRISRDIHNDEDIVEFDFVEKYYHKFDIQDAKEGDVLASGEVVFVFKVIHGVWLNCYYSAHKDGSFNADSYDLLRDEYFGEVYPAIKEQRDFLFAKRKEAGYEWDADKKELKKIESKPTWSEEDEEEFEQLLNVLHENMYESSDNWLKCLKDRVQSQDKWKPSDVQITELRRVISGCSYDIEPLAEMAEQLKKLKEE